MTLITDSSFLSLTHGFGSAMQNHVKDFFISKNRNWITKQREFDFLFEFNNFAANVVEYLPEAMGQKPLKITIEDDEELENEVQSFINYVTPYFVKATKVARHCGGAGIFLGTKDSIISEPIKITSLAIKFFNVLEGGIRGKLQIYKMDENPLSPSYQKPLYYRITNQKELIHASRILPFYGGETLTEEQMRRYRYWGIPVFNRCYEALKNLDIADSSMSSTVSQFSRLVFEIDELTALLSTEQGKQILKDRVELISYCWNVLNVLLIKANAEKVSNLKIDYNGIDLVLAHFKEMLAGSVDIPYQKLFNSGSGGTGLGNGQASSHSQNNQSDRNWSDLVNAAQNSDWLPLLSQLLLIQFPILDTKDYQVKFPTLLQLTEQEESDLKKKDAETRKINAEIEKLQSGNQTET